MEPGYKINPDVRDIFSGSKLEPVLPKQNRPNIRDSISGPDKPLLYPGYNIYIYIYIYIVQLNGDSNSVKPS